MALINLPINGLPVNLVNRPIPRLIPTPHPTEQLQVTDILNTESQYQLMENIL